MLRRKEVVVGRALPPSTEGPLPLRGTGNLGPSLRGVERQPFLSRAEAGREVGSTPLQARLKAGEGGTGVQKPKERGSLASVAGVVPAGGGEPANASLFRAAAAAGDAQRLALPLPKLEGSLPSNNPDGEGLCLPSSGFRTLAHPTPHCVHSPAAGGREEADARSSGRGCGSRLRSLGPGAPAPRLPLLRPLLRLRGRRSLRKLLRVWSWLRRPAPHPARSCSRIGAT